MLKVTCSQTETMYKSSTTRQKPHILFFLSGGRGGGAYFKSWPIGGHLFEEGGLIRGFALYV